MTPEERTQRMEQLLGELEQLAAHDTLTRAQEHRAIQLRAELNTLERDDILCRLGTGDLRLERGASPDDGVSTRPREGLRGHALDTLERTERGFDHLTRGQLDTAARLVESDPTDTAARWVTVAGDPDYLRAFQKLTRDPQRGHLEFTDAERAAYARAQELARALNLGDSAGGYMVPFTLDPAIVLSNAGTSNTNLRAAFTVKQTVTDTWNGVTSAGVTAQWAAEAAEVPDNSPTLGPIAIPTQKGDAWVPFSIEVGMDAANFAAEMARLLADAKLRLEAAGFITGSGVGQPRGLVTAAVAAAKTVAVVTDGTFAVADVYAMKAALPARWRAAAAWLANENIYDRARQFATGTGPQSAFWADFGEATPPKLLGKPAFESSEVDGVIDAAANNYILAYGDLKQYYVVDRIGTTIELVPHLFGANRRPTGERGFFMYFRTGGDLAVADAVRVLNA